MGKDVPSSQLHISLFQVVLTDNLFLTLDMYFLIEYGQVEKHPSVFIPFKKQLVSKFSNIHTD